MAFGFLKAPFKAIGGLAKGVAKGVGKVASFVGKKLPATAVGFLTAGPVGAGVAFGGQVIAGGGGGRPPPDEFSSPAFAAPGIAPGQLPRGTDRFSLANTIATWVEQNLPGVATAARGALETGRGEVREQARAGITPIILGAAVAIPVATVLLVTLTRKGR